MRVDGKRLGAAERTRLFLFHKPRGFVTTARDPEGRPTVFSALPPGLPRVVAVGRLDINTEGLLLLTNDGGLARVLELPSTGWLRRYRVRAHGVIDQATLDALSGGITIDGVDYLGIEAKLDRQQGSNAWITLGLREGKNREIKKVLEHLGLAVNRLIRVSFGPFELGDLAEGEAAEVRTRVLRDQLGAKLAKEAQADFDAPLNAREPEAPAEPRAEEREARRASRPHERSGRDPGRDKPGRDGRRGPGKEREGRFNRDAAAPRPPPARSTHEPRRMHVSRLRAEIAADAAATRKRIERSATHDRKGRTIAVERLSPTREEARRRAAAENARPRTSRPGRASPSARGTSAGRDRTRRKAAAGPNSSRAGKARSVATPAHGSAVSNGRRAGASFAPARAARRARTQEGAPNSSRENSATSRATALRRSAGSIAPRIRAVAGASSTDREATAAVPAATAGRARRRGDRMGRPARNLAARGRRRVAAARAARRGSRELMRIVGGRFKGRTLAAPSSRAIRPTSERLRESIFDILEHRFPGHIEGARVVDLFAGSGALAIEALSRGARFALFVDNGAEARAVLRANVEAFALGGVTRIWRADATKLGAAPAGGPFALAFLDPPYGASLAGPALASLVGGGWLEQDALVVVEEAAKAEIAAPAGLASVDERTYGDTRIAIFRAEATAGK